MLRSSPKCGRKGFRPEAVLESGLKELEGLDKGPEELKVLEELKGIEEDTDLIDEEVLQRQNGTSEDEENTKSSQVWSHFYLSPSYLLHSA